MERLHHNGRRRVVVGDGVRLAATEWGAPGGDRPTVLLVHGHPDTSAVWPPVVERLAEHHHVVAFLLPGAGLAWRAGRSRAGRRAPDRRRRVKPPAAARPGATGDHGIAGPRTVPASAGTGTRATVATDRSDKEPLFPWPPQIG